MDKNNNKHAEAKNCWEFMDCPEKTREKCRVYTTNLGNSCWMLATGLKARNLGCFNVKENFEHCWECPWFKKLNPDFNGKQ